MISLDDRLRVSHQFSHWAHENKLELSPSKFLAYLDLKGYLNAEYLVEDSKKMEQLEEQQPDKEGDNAN